MERPNSRKVLRGVVASDKMDKTIVVEIMERALSSRADLRLMMKTMKLM